MVAVLPFQLLRSFTAFAERKAHAMLLRMPFSFFLLLLSYAAALSLHRE